MSTIRYYRLFDDDGQATHIEGAGESYTLCGHDTAGDDRVHRKPPQLLPAGKHRITCKHCLQIIDLVRDHLNSK